VNRWQNGALAAQASERAQRAARAATEALDDRARVDALVRAGVDSITLRCGRRIEVRGSGQTLRDVLDDLRLDPPALRIAPEAAAIGAHLDSESIEQGEPA